jgi:hypothetical protein
MVTLAGEELFFKSKHKLKDLGIVRLLNEESPREIVDEARDAGQVRASLVHL